MGGYSNLSKMSQQQKQFSQHQQMHPGQMHGHVGVSYRTFFIIFTIVFQGVIAKYESFYESSKYTSS